MQALAKPSWHERTPLLRPTAAFLLGGLLGLHTPLRLTTAYSIGWALFGTYCLLQRQATYPRWHSVQGLLGGLGLATLAAWGHVAALQGRAEQAADHLLWHAAPIEAYEAVVTATPRRAGRHTSCRLHVSRVRSQGVWHTAQGSVAAYVPHHAAGQLRYGAQLLVLGPPEVAGAAPDTPARGDAQLLVRQGITHRHWLQQGQWALTGYNPPSRLQALLLRGRGACTRQLSKHLQHPEALAVAQALLLGVRHDLPATLRSAYAGAIHVLAISGLHTGMLYLMLVFLLGLLGGPLRRGADLIALGLLWGYAGMSGAMPSVLRSVLMWSFAVAGRRLGRGSQGFHSLIGSAWCLLVYDIRLVLHPSFQLSYLAVWGIMYLHPLLMRGLPLHRLPVLGTATSITLAAQAATAPLIIYYFHHLPTYFILAGWVLVPATALALGLGLVLLASSGCPPLAHQVGRLLEQVLLGMNSYATLLHQLPGSQVGPWAPSALSVALVYAAGLALYRGALRTRPA